MLHCKWVVVAIAFVMLLLSVSVVGAQDSSGDAQSDGCIAFSDLTTTGAAVNFNTLTYAEDEVLIISVTGSGNTFTLLESGSPVSDSINVGETLVYLIEAAGDYTFTIEIDGSDGTSTTTTDCNEREDVDPVLLVGGPVTLCHYPPGNPAAAHTITVGAPAVWAHLGHGDTLGPCPANVETRYDDYESGIAIFVLDDFGQVQIYGICGSDECQPIGVVDVSLLNPNPDFSLPVAGVPDDGYVIIVYYLHPFPDRDGEDEGEDEDTTINVFQINVYLNDTLLNDNVLLMVGEDGRIISWADQGVWDDLDAFRVAFDIDD